MIKKVILLWIITLLSPHILFAATISNSYSPNSQIPIGGSNLYYVPLSGVPSDAKITKVEVRFTYIAYGIVQNYLSARLDKGSDPGTYSGVYLLPKGNLPEGNPGTYGYNSFNNWNGESVNSKYYIRFFTDSNSPYAPTIKKIDIRITYSLDNKPYFQ